MLTLLLRLSTGIDRLNDRIGSAVGWTIPLAVMIAAVYALARFLFADTDIGWIDAVFNQRSNAWFEIQWYLFAAVVLFASSTTLRRNEHVRIDVLADRLSVRARCWIELFGIVLFLLPLCGVILLYGTPYALLSIRSQEINNAGGLPTWPAKTMIVLGFAALALQGLSELVKRIAVLSGRLAAHDAERPRLHGTGSHVNRVEGP